jgi:hypothetical protein
MYTYKAYNLEIQSDIFFPELPIIVSSGSTDLVVRRGSLSSFNVGKENDSAYFLGQVAGAGLFAVQAGCEIVVDAESGVEEGLIRPLILGPMMSILLRQRGMLVLHASSVEIEGAAVAFMGHSGWGKSTLADSFHAKGYHLLTDDVMALHMDAEQPIVIPSFPQVKLWPDAAASIGHDPNSLPLLNSKSEKLAHKITDGFLQKSVPLKRLYVLGMGTEHKIVPLQPQEAFVELVRHSRTITLLDDSVFLSTHLHHCTKLVKTVPIALLNRKRSLAAIPELIESIEEDIMKLQKQHDQNSETDIHHLCSV